jgi:hypothetical protein
MWEGDVDAAWQAAQHGGCTRAHRLKLARARVEQHPADAMPVLRREVLAAIEGGKRPANHAAAQLAKELRGTRNAQAGWTGSRSGSVRYARTAPAVVPLQDEFNNAGSHAEPGLRAPDVDVLHGGHRKQVAVAAVVGIARGSVYVRAAWNVLHRARDPAAHFRSAWPQSHFAKIRSFTGTVKGLILAMR